MIFKEWLAKFSARWQAFNQVQKAVAILAVTGLLVTLVILGQVLFRTPYAPLFTGLDPKEAGRISEELKKEKIPYQVTDQGKTIQVPEKLVYETRIKLASGGALYNSGSGFELFDEKKFGVTEFEQQVGYQRALQEELRRTIVQVEGVEQARVHLVLPKKSLFLNEQSDSSASIALKINPTAKISSENVRGIIDLVTGSVEGLKPENIHIIDMQGNSLSDNLRFGDSSVKLGQAALDRIEIRRAFEKEMETRIQHMLRQVLGQGMAVAMVTAELDFDQQQSKIVSYDKGQVLSEHTLTEEGTGPGGSGGVPGTDSDLPGGSIPASGGADGGSSFSKEETTTNFNVPGKEETMIKAPGDLKRLSTSIVLNGNYSQSQIQQIHDTVAAAIGFNDNRGDQISVTSMAFDDTDKKEIGAELARLQAEEAGRQQMFSIAVIAASAIILLALLGWYISKQLRKRSERVAEMSKQMDEAGGLDFLEGEEARLEVPEMVTKQDELRGLAAQNPAEVAEVIKLWMKE